MNLPFERTVGLVSFAFALSDQGGDATIAELKQ